MVTDQQRQQMQALLTDAHPNSQQLICAVRELLQALAEAETAAETWMNLAKAKNLMQDQADRAIRQHVQQLTEQRDSARSRMQELIQTLRQIDDQLTMDDFGVLQMPARAYPDVERLLNPAAPECAPDQQEKTL